jgi:hypothetical protein
MSCHAVEISRHFYPEDGMFATSYTVLCGFVPVLGTHGVTAEDHNTVSLPKRGGAVNMGLRSTEMCYSGTYRHDLIQHDAFITQYVRR